MIHPKVAAAGLGGAVSIVVVWTVTLFGVEVPPSVASAFTTILSFACGYLKGA
jgi:hypothetical protein